MTTPVTSTPGTLGFHRDMAAILLGEDSPAVTYLDAMIVRSRVGRDEEVIAAESQVIALLIELHEQDKKHLAEVKAREVRAELY